MEAAYAVTRGRVRIPYLPHLGDASRLVPAAVLNIVGGHTRGRSTRPVSAMLRYHSLVVEPPFKRMHARSNRARSTSPDVSTDRPTGFYPVGCAFESRSGTSSPGSSTDRAATS